MSDQTVIFGLWAICFIVYVIEGIRRRRRLKEYQQWAALHAPLTAATSRLDGALRDAEDGFNACAVCGFENLKRRIYCLLCGTPVGAEPAQQPPPQQLTTRQQRARMRKEWQRQLDDESGDLRWVRHEGETTTGPLPAYKLEFTVLQAPMVSKGDSIQPEGISTPTGFPHDEPEEEPMSEAECPNDSTVLNIEALAPNTTEEDSQDTRTSPLPRLQLRGLKDVDAEIHAQLSSSEMRLLDAASADPSTLSLRFMTTPEDQRESPGSTEQRQAEKKAFIHDASLPFPSKLVQFIAHSTAIQQPPQPPPSNATQPPNAVSANTNIQLRVDRDRLLADSIATLAGLPSETVRFGFRIAFLGETAVDAGGVYREWLLLVNEAIVAPEAGIFTCVDAQDQAFYLNPYSKECLGDHHLAHVVAAGRLLGRALLEGNVTGFHLALPLLKIILGQPVGLHDVAYFDPEVHKSLVWLLENDGVDALGLDFTVVEKAPDGTTRIVELVPRGSERNLTDTNKYEYVDRKLQYLLFERIQPQLFAFLKGIHDVVPMELLMLFDAEELDYMLSGSDEIDVDDWETHTKYTSNLIDHHVRKWFWEIVREMTNEHRRRLLQFATGASRVPLAGFAGLTSFDGRLCPFTLMGVGLHQEQYLRSHACFNQLDLPMYETKQQLMAMLTAITTDDTMLHGFTIA